jgi:hypothetical protein
LNLVERDRSEIGGLARWQAHTGDGCATHGAEVFNERRRIDWIAEPDWEINERLGRGHPLKTGHAQGRQHVAVVDADAGAHQASGACGDDQTQGDGIGHRRGGERRPQLGAVSLGGSQADWIPTCIYV